MKRLIMLIAVVALIAAACSSDDGGSDTTAAGEATTVAEGGDATGTTKTTEGSTGTTKTTAGEGGGAVSEVQAMVDACEPDEVDGDLNFYNWTEYIPYGGAAEDAELEDLIAKFEEQYGVKVTQTFYDSNETMLPQVEAGGAPYDLIVPSDYMVAIMSDPEVDLLTRINYDAIPNMANLDPTFRGLPYDPDEEFSVPYQWGTSGLGYSYEYVDDEDGVSWGLIFDPEMNAEMAGAITMLNDERESLGAALKYLGYSVNTTDEAQIAEASDVLAGARDAIAAFDSESFDDLLVSGETVLAHGWNGSFFSSYDAEDAWEEYGYSVPAEGGIAWVDAMAVPTTTEHPCTAHTFMNFILDAENGATLTNYTFYGSPNLAATEFIYPEILEDPAIYPDEATMAQLEFIADVGAAATLYADAFALAKG